MDVLEGSFSDLVEEVVFVFCSEGVVALQDDKEEDAETPHVCVDRYVIFF